MTDPTDIRIGLDILNARLSRRSTDGLELDAAAVAKEIHDGFSFVVIRGKHGGAVAFAKKLPSKRQLDRIDTLVEEGMR